MKLTPNLDGIINKELEVSSISKQSEETSKSDKATLDFKKYLESPTLSETSEMPAFEPYSLDSDFQVAPAKTEMPDTKDIKAVMEFFYLTGDIEDYEIKKDKNGNITDIYKKSASNDNNGAAERFSLRYDANGNVVKSFIQDIDKNGNVLGQEIKNYNEDGSLKNTVYYRYQFDESGNQIGQIRDAIDAKQGDPFVILASFGLGYSELPKKLVCNHIEPIGIPQMVSCEGVENVQKNKDGQITDLTYNGVRYSIRYDSEGNVVKTIVQKFDDNGKISSQTITNIKADGTKIPEIHTYDENGVDNTSDAQKAINKVVSLYTTKSGDISKSQDAFNKFQSFIENNTMAKLKSAGVSNEAIQALLDNLFKNVDEKLYNKQFSGTEAEKELITKYKEQYQKIFGIQPMLMYLDSIKTE